jgi:hypothetical protein
VTLAGLLRAFDVRGRFTIVCDIGGAEWDLVANNAPAIAMCETIIVRLDPGALMDRGRQVHEFIEKLAAAGLNPVAREGFVLVAGRRPSETSETRPTASRGTPGHC